MKITRKQYRTKQNIKCIKRNAYDLLLGFEQVFCVVLDVLILLSGFVTIVNFAGAVANYNYIGVLWCFVFVLEFALFLGIRNSCYQDIKADLDEKNKKENKDNQIESTESENEVKDFKERYKVSESNMQLNSIEQEVDNLETKDDVLKYIGLFIQQSMKSGDSLPQAINNLNCFDSTLIQYITHGEHKSKLDLELYYFSVYMLEKLEKSIIKHLKWVQPIVFGTLAFLIVTLYLIIILPMLQMVDGIK